MPWSPQQLLADLVRTVRTGGDLGPSSGDGSTYEMEIPLRAPLVQFASTERFARLDRQESYFRKRQHDHKTHQWSGEFVAYRSERGIPPGYVVPYSQRRPCAKYDLAAIIVQRFTSLLFGQDRFPLLNMPGDPDGEDALKTLLVDVGELPSAMMESRDLGGAVGTGTISFAFVEGPSMSGEGTASHLRFEAHNAKHCTVLRWADEHTRRAAAVLKTYAYPRQVWDPEQKRVREVMYYYARYWDEQREIVWKPIPERIAKLSNWSDIPELRTEVRHGLGFCPFYWIQNIRDSAEPDGEGDYEGLEPNFDSVDEILSASTTGTKVNVDPTLVINMNRAQAGGDPVVRKGNGTVIFSENGADYLTLKADAMKAAIDQLERIRLYMLDAAHVVLADPDKLSGSAQSAAALRILYAPMLARADLLRVQYGRALRMIAKDVLRAARMIERADPIPVPDEEGSAYRGRTVKPTVYLPPREVEDEATGEITFKPRTLGTLENVTLNWNPYFSPSWRDIKEATEAAQTANGGKPVISQRTSIAAVQALYGVSDVDAEQEAIREDAEEGLDMMNRSLAGEGAPGKPTEDPEEAREERTDEKDEGKSEEATEE